jgi:hypothetical protein
MKIISTPFIEFKTEKELWNAIPAPYPASNFLPQWLKKLPPKSNKIDGFFQNTVKRCAPFMEAINLGWIIPTPADFELTIDEYGNVSSESHFEYSVLEQHHIEQVGGEKGPCQSITPMKFINYWSIKVPKGYSVLFIPPLNRYNNVFEPFSGVVECDKYWNTVNFPARALIKNFKGIIKRGTPLVQVIPFPRVAIPKKSKCGPYSSKESKMFNVTKKRLGSQTSFYREEIWNKNKCPF